jgi:anti-sigma factor RsiW
MLAKHVTEHLSAYCHGELAQAEMRRVSEHLLQCPECRREYDTVRFGVSLAKVLKPAKAPDDLWGGIEAALDNPSPAAEPIVATPSRWQWSAARIGVLAASLVVVAGITFVAYRQLAPSTPIATLPSLAVENIAGAPLVDSNPIEDSGRLSEGSLLETDGSSRATIRLREIGDVDVEPNSRVRLLDTGTDLQRLELERGRVSARVLAPPRLFVIDTPSATAVDLGCAYTLEVDDLGATLLRVTSGWVALAINGHEVEVPAGAVCRTVPGRGQGTPYFDDASPAFRSGVDYFDATSDSAVLAVVLNEARRRDTLTLWNLLPRVDVEWRGRICDRMVTLTPPPRGVTRDGVLGLDGAMLDRWYDEIEYGWYE